MSVRARDYILGWMPSDEYFAAFVDAEGCIGAYRGRGKKNVRITVQTSNTNREVLDLMHARFGGHVYSVRKQKPHHLDKWVHVTSGARAYDMIVALNPHLIVKREKARKILAEVPRPLPWGKDKTHCVRGHEFTEANTKRTPRGIG